MILITVKFLLVFILILLAICAGLIFYLVIKRRQQEKSRKAAEHYKEKTKEFWQAYLLEDGVLHQAQTPMNKSKIQAIESIFLSYVQNISNEEMKLKIRDFSRQYLLDYYKQEAASKNWGRRMNALSKVIDFQLVELVPFYEQMGNKPKSREEQFLLLKIYSIFENEKFFSNIFSKESVYSEMEYKQIFSSLDESILLELVRKMGDLPTSAQYALVDTVAIKGNTEIAVLLESFFDSPDPELRIRSLKGIEKLGFIKNLELYFAFVTSALWEERLMVAKVFVHVPLKYTQRHLKLLMLDSNYLVRQQALKTIMAFPEGAKMVNKEMVVLVENESANAMASESMLTKRQM